MSRISLLLKGGWDMLQNVKGKWPYNRQTVDMNCLKQHTCANSLLKVVLGFESKEEGHIVTCYSCSS